MKIEIKATEDDGNVIRYFKIVNAEGMKWSDLMWKFVHFLNFLSFRVNTEEFEDILGPEEY